MIKLGCARSYPEAGRQTASVIAGFREAIWQSQLRGGCVHSARAWLSCLAVAIGIVAERT